MKTSEEILEQNCPVFGALFLDKKNKAVMEMHTSILKAMEEYARIKWDQACDELYKEYENHGRAPKPVFKP